MTENFELTKYLYIFQGVYDALRNHLHLILVPFQPLFALVSPKI